jgi:ribonuclease VapC
MILDASALLVFLLSEPGEDRVAEALLNGATMSTLNFAEVASRYVARGAGGRAETLLRRLPISLVAVDEDLAEQSAHLASHALAGPLPLGDRVCLALGQRMEMTILTADPSWLAVAVRVGARVELVHQTVIRAGGLAEAVKHAFKQTAEAVTAAPPRIGF